MGLVVSEVRVRSGSRSQIFCGPERSMPSRCAKNASSMQLSTVRVSLSSARVVHTGRLVDGALVVVLKHAKPLSVPSASVWVSAQTGDGAHKIYPQLSAQICSDEARL